MKITRSGPVTEPVVRLNVAGEHTKEASAASIREPGRSYTVIYDGHCKVCGRTVNLLAKWDRKRELEIIPSQTPGVHARFPWIPQRSYAESVQVIRNSDGKTWQATAAIEELLRVLPKGRLISWLFKIPFARPLAERFYRWFARNRYRMGCSEHCALRPAALESQDADASTSGP
jgi:predicted DCC family thiol-disulfide oxidoreductase YuxK